MLWAGRTFEAQNSPTGPAYREHCGVLLFPVPRTVPAAAESRPSSFQNPVSFTHLLILAEKLLASCWPSTQPGCSHRPGMPRGGWVELESAWHVADPNTVNMETQAHVSSLRANPVQSTSNPWGCQRHSQQHQAESLYTLLGSLVPEIRVSSLWSPHIPYLCQQWAEDVQGLTPQVGHLPQRNSVHCVRILILFIYLAKTQKLKVRMSEDKKANATLHWPVHWGFTKCHSFDPPTQFCVRTGTEGQRRIKHLAQGAGVPTWLKAAVDELKSRPASRPVFLQAHWLQKADRQWKPGLPSLSTALDNKFINSYFHLADLWAQWSKTSAYRPCQCIAGC